MFIIMHSYVLLFLCLYLLLPSAFVKFRSLVLARDDGVGGTCSVLWVVTFFLDRRTCVKRASQGKTQAVPAR